MKKVSLSIAKQKYQISLQPDRTFEVSQDENHLATIYPSQGHLKLIWKSKDKIEGSLLSKLGEAIEAYQRSSQTL
ncbi:hypothetical protein [Pedobacter aquatilis]|uniref:hypothetical protein n=1 Tax=Pedobacter aquatilis TaxID=351343 RepID=UPI00292FC534|nr:hypothetical protein [Pedobacter aquatilis]